MDEELSVQEDRPKDVSVLYAARIRVLIVLLRHQAVIEPLMEYIEMHMEYRLYVICAEILGVAEWGADPSFYPGDGGCCGCL